MLELVSKGTVEAPGLRPGKTEVGKSEAKRS